MTYATHRHCIQCGPSSGTFSRARISFSAPYKIYKTKIRPDHQTSTDSEFDSEPIAAIIKNSPYKNHRPHTLAGSTIPFPSPPGPPNYGKLKIRLNKYIMKEESLINWSDAPAIWPTNQQQQQQQNNITYKIAANQNEKVCMTPYVDSVRAA